MESIGIQRTWFDKPLMNPRINKPLLLLIDRNLGVRTSMKDIFSGDFNYFSIDGAENGLETVIQLNPQIILLDFKTCGYEMGNVLKHNPATSHIPFAFLSKFGSHREVVRALNAGAIDCFSNSVEPDLLRLKMLNWVKNLERSRNMFNTNHIIKPREIRLNRREEQLLQKIISVVNDHLEDTDLDVESLSSYLSLSSNQVYRKIKILTGYTAKEFIRVQRLNTAASLLAQKKRNISEIVYMVGFSSPSYFSKCFKEQFDCTPSEFIEKKLVSCI